MWREELRPLPTEIWLAEMDELRSHALVLAEDHAVRRAFHLSMLSPMPVRRAFAPGLTESELELLLERGEADRAAAAIADGAGAMDVARCSGTDRYRAVLNVEEGEDICFEAASPALARIGVWATYLTTAPDSLSGNPAAVRPVRLRARS